ncbi:hypothetical protein BN1232_00714 [Mycobacterium lentiflavum]|uniref:Uncharacterized protein n=1 Tax=Mycobacterium lentiflavum TaxID=141349 RepID=A0A0E4GVB8_MYCLN|nr:hypothetical protein [Mycobacterium lentiflavum]MEE3065723.1 hypothetical protein [Actinomycetota bacterium]ULP42944.1 hypothetical protein MJO58_02740 [Mycobacterium lentiflavum]CQD04577.1 hypothetical protein BN1232_00714 [Mycobacterium lentiflavum]
MARRPAADHHLKWLANAERLGVPAAVTSAIAEQHGITHESFRVLEELAEITDPDGKSFFLIPPGTTGDTARTATLMTYILNAGSGYGAPTGPPTDFPATPYSADEVQRIVDRQHANSWSYDEDVGFVDRNGGRLVTTPNGMLMGLGGNWIQRLFSQQGGTAWGDIFMVNVAVDATDSTARRLRQIVESGHAWYTDRKGRPVESALALDRVLHHEELHSQQWAAKGHSRMIVAYLWEVARDRLFGKTNRLEEQAGLADGGYR